MFCPICGSTDIKRVESGNSKSHYEVNMFVAEESPDCTEFYDDVAYCQCEKRHTFYVSKSMMYSGLKKLTEDDLKILEMIDALPNGGVVLRDDDDEDDEDEEED